MSESEFKAIEWRSLKESVSELLFERWMLITAGTTGRWNTMTASWGGFGHVWSRDL